MLNFVKADTGTTEMIEYINQTSAIIDLYPEIFPHLYQQGFKLEKYIVKGNLILQDGVFITFSKYKTNGKISKNDVKNVLSIPHKPANIYKKKGDFIIHQIGSNQSNKTAAIMTLSLFREHCKSKHTENIWLTVRDENQNAIRFYERFGFVREGDIFWTSKTDGIIPGGVYKLKLDANKNIETVCI